MPDDNVAPKLGISRIAGADSKPITSCDASSTGNKGLHTISPYGINDPLHRELVSEIRELKDMGKKIIELMEEMMGG